MCYRLSFDGGGTKSRAILFGENGPLGVGESGGTNTNFISRAECAKNIRECLDQALKPVSPARIETVYAVIVGPAEELERALRERAALGRMAQIPEGAAGVVAGLLRRDGLCVISGTGSDAFYMGKDGKYRVVGGYGSILGDQGSGYWIGQAALKTALAYDEGWGEPTMLLPMIQDAWKVKSKHELMQTVYSCPAPFRKVASVVPIVGEAARLGDAFSIALFEKAGRVLAAQALALLQKAEIPKEAHELVCCGGAWKAHPAMFETFLTEMTLAAPCISIKKPMFEHVMAGVILHSMETHPGAEPRALADLLRDSYGAFQITW